MGDPPGIFSHQIGLDLRYRGLYGFGPALQQGLSQARDAGVGVDFQENPSWLDQECFQPGYLQ